MRFSHLRRRQVCGGIAVPCTLPHIMCSVQSSGPLAHPVKGPIAHLPYVVPCELPLTWPPADPQPAYRSTWPLDPSSVACSCSCMRTVSLVCGAARPAAYAALFAPAGRFSPSSPGGGHWGDRQWRRSRSVPWPPCVSRPWASRECLEVTIHPAHALRPCCCTCVHFPWACDAQAGEPVCGPCYAPGKALYSACGAPG